MCIIAGYAGPERAAPILIEMLRKIIHGKLGNTRSADMRKRSRLRTVTQSHHADLAVCVSGARILTVGQIVSRRIFAILRDFPVSIHVVYLFPKQKNS